MKALTALFRRIDSNNNGSIEKLEFLKAVSKVEIIDTINEHDFLKPFLKPKSFEESFLNMDTNSDKHITLEEFLKYSDREIYTSSASPDADSSNRNILIDDLDDSSSSSFSSSDSASSTSEEEDDDQKENATALNEIKEISKRETTLRDIENVLKAKEKDMAKSVALPLGSLNTRGLILASRYSFLLKGHQPSCYLPCCHSWWYNYLRRFNTTVSRTKFPHKRLV